MILVLKLLLGYFVGKIFGTLHAKNIMSMASSLLCTIGVTLSMCNLIDTIGLK